MTQKEARAESSGRRFPRAGWIVGGVLLFAAAGVFWLWSRPSQIRLSDGTTLTVAAVTVGMEHWEAQPSTRQVFGMRIGGGAQWPRQGTRTFSPMTLVWFEDQTVRKRYDLLLVDRLGWRWKTPQDSRGVAPSFPEVDVDDEVQVVVLDKAGTTLGEGLLPVTRVASPPWPGVPSPMQRPDLMPALGEAPPLPIQLTDGPLTATLKAVEIAVVKEPVSRCDVRLDLETLWNGEPFAREFGYVTLIDSRGRCDRIRVDPAGRFSTTLSPLATMWDLHMQILRGPEAVLEPEDTVVVTPDLAEGAPFTWQDGMIHGRKWRVVLVPSGTLHLPLQYGEGFVRLNETIPVLFTEVEPWLQRRVHIEPLDAQGELLPVVKVDTNGFPGNIHAVGCPTFDVTKGHRIRARFNVARQVKFSIRPDVAPGNGSP